ncbi:MAG: PEP/pyruvate-binding domain-containing protein, partial [Chloroflexota bacterium]
MTQTVLRGLGEATAVQWLDSPTPPGDSTGLGGKAHSLARLIAAQLPVPPGFVVTAGALDAAAGPAEAALPAAVERQIKDAYAGLGRRLGDPAPRVAVRSSGAAEDLKDASFAGQYDTFLGVRGVEAV